MYRKDTCSIQNRMEKGDTVVEEEADSTKADITKKNPMNTTSITGKRSQTCEDERLEDGEKSCRTKLTNQLCPVWILWQIRPLRDGVSDSKEEKWIGLHKTIIHQLCLKLWLWRSWWNVRNEAQSKLNDGLQPDHHLQLRKCMVCWLGCIQSQMSHEDWFWELRQFGRAMWKLGWHNSPHSTCRCQIVEQGILYARVNGWVKAWEWEQLDVSLT